jgi:taurine dioxygenase/putative 2-oxoglutarate oxygenase
MTPPEYNLPGFPEVLVVSNVEKDNKPDRHEARGVGMAFRRRDKVLPNAGSFIYAIELPPPTATRCTPTPMLAFAALPDDVRRRILGRRACLAARVSHEVYYPHLGPLTEEQKKARPDVWHPIARRQSSLRLDVALHRTLGVQGRRNADDEAQELIDYLKDFARVRNSSTVTSGAPATRCFGTTAVRSIARHRSTTRSIGA